MPEAAIVRTRSGERYKPSAIRSYEAALRNYLLPEFGHLRLSAITRTRIQDLADSLVLAGKAPATVANAILPLRAIYRRAARPRGAHRQPDRAAQPAARPRHA